jgi:signal peptidase I
VGGRLHWLVVVTQTTEPELDADAEPARPVDDGRTFRRIVWFAAAIIVLLLVRGFLIEPVRVRSDSMEPTLRAGSLVLIDKITFDFREPRRGDVVVTSDPRTGETIVKRVVAVAGDSVGIENGLLVVNGATVVEHYIENGNMEGFYFGPDVVPADDVFLLGDNRDISVDSRTFGPVAVDDVEGRVVATIWPP